MVLSRDLIISLGFTLVIGVLLFFFVKQRTSVVEEKINTLIQFVQEETAQRNLQYHANLNSSGQSEEMKVYETTQQNASNERIDVSDDEDEFTDSESEYTDTDSDASSVSSEAEQVITKDVSLVEEEVSNYIKSVSLTGTSTGAVSSNTVTESNLEELNVETLDSEQPSEEQNETENSPSVLQQIQEGSQNNNDTNVSNDTSEETKQTVVSEINYNKLKVNELRDIITERGLASNITVKTLKKKELISLLETS